MLRAAAIALALTAWCPPVTAHEFLLNGTQSPAGEWCCGAGDCGLVEPGAFTAVKGGYLVVGRVVYGEAATGNKADGPARTESISEFWPHRETMPSPDGRAWRCHRPDGTPRCKFKAQPGT